MVESRVMQSIPTWLDVELARQLPKHRFTLCPSVQLPYEVVSSP